MPIPVVVPVKGRSDGFSAITSTAQWDSVILVANGTTGFQELVLLHEVVQRAIKYDAEAAESVTLMIDERVAGGRLVFAPTGPLNRDQDDVRRIGEAAKAGVKRAKAAGSVKPLFVFAPVPQIQSTTTHAPADAFKHALEVGLLGAMQALYADIEAREYYGEDKVEPIKELGFLCDFGAAASNDPERIVKVVQALEEGRRVSRDLGAGHPERMTPLKCVEYCQQVFAGVKNVKLDVIQGDEFVREYPLTAAVARASAGVEHHAPCVLRIEYYNPEEETKETVMLAGKGVTYDTGGADIKAGGHMSGMSKDKGGAASVAGFIKTISLLRPRGLRVVAELGLVRNDVGPRSYVADEVIISHAGVRVKVGNTDAEGRMVMADLLSHLRERCITDKSIVNPRLFTCATLTGHAPRAVGTYGLCLDNGPARRLGISRRLYDAGELWGDNFEVSSIRREDYDFIKPKNNTYDVLQCNNAPSSGTSRGHQFPAAFLIVASGLDKHGIDSQQPIPFTHLDIAGNYVEDDDWQFGKVTAAPVVALAALFVPEVVGGSNNSQ